MKYLLILTLLAGCSTSPKFKVGDCSIIDGNLAKVVSVGSDSYELVLLNGVGAVATFKYLEENHPKVDCFNLFNEDKK